MLFRNPSTFTNFIAHVGLRVIKTRAAQNIISAVRNTGGPPQRWMSFAPSMKPATSIDYATIPLATIVGGTPKCSPFHCVRPVSRRR